MQRSGYWRAKILSNFPEISHGFVSDPFSFDPSINLKNLKAFYNLYKLTNISFKDWVIAGQVHGDNFSYVEKDRNLFMPKIIKNIDALLTSEKRRMIVMFFADCFPVYIFIPKIPLIGLIHVGWRGAIKMLPLKILKEIFNTYKISPNEIFLAVGPGIQRCCFQVDNNFVEYLDEQSLDYLEKRKENFYFDIKRFIISQISVFGISEKNLEYSEICTKCNLDFYSFRRDKTRKRNVGFIYIK